MPSPNPSRKVGAQELIEWLTQKVLVYDCHESHLEAAAYQRLRELKLEPPSPERVERLIRSAIRTCESSFCERILDQLSAESQQKLDALLKTEGALDEDEHSQFKQSDFNILKTGEPLGFVTLITPSEEKIQIHLDEIGKVIDTHKEAPQEALIGNLNPIIGGWANYYSTAVSKRIFTKLDYLTYEKLRAWASRRCTRSNKQEIANKYWRTVGNDNWRFSTHDRLKLAKHTETPIVRHTKVEGERSPFDGDWVYWSTRMGKHPEVSNRVATLLMRQKGKCTHCGLFFKVEDLIEIDHKTPKIKGGLNKLDNLQALHRHCHDTKTARDDVAFGTNPVEIAPSLSPNNGPSRRV